MTDPVAPAAPAMKAHSHTFGARPEHLVWREPGAVAQRAFRSCGYCGSIHPGDLAAILRANPTASLELADMKYGWPHKFYGHGVPAISWMKFYSEHLRDATPDDKQTIEQFGRISFSFEPGGAVRWSAYSPASSHMESNRDGA